MIDAEMITRKQARNHPESHILSRAIGSRPEVEIDISPPHKLEDGDALLLCSDGLSGFVPDGKIRKTLEHQTDVQRVASDLVDLALAAGSNDNITVQYVRFGKTVRERVTTKLPIAARPIPDFSVWNMWNVWDVLAAVSKRPAAAWTVLVVASMTVAAIPLLALRPPTLEFDSKVEGGQVVLTWKAEKAESLDIQPSVQSTPLKLEGMATVSLPLTSRIYTATATAKRLLLVTVKAEKSLTIAPPGAAPAETPPATPAPEPQTPGATAAESAPPSVSQPGGRPATTTAPGNTNRTINGRTTPVKPTDTSAASGGASAKAPATGAEKEGTGPAAPGATAPAATPPGSENALPTKEETPVRDGAAPPADGARDPQLGGRAVDRAPHGRG
jgi:hypothetical protein